MSTTNNTAGACDHDDSEGCENCDPGGVPSGSVWGDAEGDWEIADLLTERHDAHARY